MTKGTVVQVVGPTVDVEFPSDKLPSILNAVRIEDAGRDDPGLSRSGTGA